MARYYKKSRSAVQAAYWRGVRAGKKYARARRRRW